MRIGSSKVAGLPTMTMSVCREPATRSTRCSWQESIPWDKLDAGLLAVAVAGAALWIYGRFPWKVAWCSLLTVFPWFLFSWIYFGSLLPNSLIAKLHGSPRSHFDPLWIVELLRGAFRYL